MDLKEYSSIENNEVIDETTNVEENLNSGFDMNDVTMKLLMNH